MSASYTEAIIKDVYYSCKFTVISFMLRQIDVRVNSLQSECPATCVGETGRTRDCRIKEHKRSTEKQDEGRTESQFIIWKRNTKLIGREPLVWNSTLLRMRECF